jgi:hypothetical protein
MARHGIQQGSLLLRVSDILAGQFSRDERKPVSVSKIIELLKNEQDKEYTPLSIKSTLRDHFGRQLTIVDDDIALNPAWGTIEDFEETIASFKKMAEIAPNKEGTASTRLPGRK